MSLTKDQITAALRKSGPMLIGALASSLDVDRAALQYHLKGMPDLKYGGSRIARQVALADQKIEAAEDTPPKKRNGKARKGHRAKKPAPRPTPPKQPDEPEFLPAVTADARLVILNGVHRPQIFTPQQTEDIATLLGGRFEEA